MDRKWHKDKNIWSKALDKIVDYFEHWSRGNLTIFGRRLIAQMFRGGVSQYLTTVQGMPKKIESTLQKMINKFVWDGKWPLINQQILGMPIHDSGIQLLDIKSRNETIELMWLKKYLQFGEERLIF